MKFTPLLDPWKKTTSYFICSKNFSQTRLYILFVSFHLYDFLSVIGWILIDRCGKHFGTILNFLRDGSVSLPESTKEMAELLAEAKYYCISELAESCEQALLRKEREAEPICRVPLITSQKEEQLLISNTTKPVVKLLINRHNNKYSYTR